MWPLILLLCFYNIITDNDVDKHLFETDLLYFKHKRKGLYVPLQGVNVGIWMQGVTEFCSILGLLCPDDILTLEPSPKEKLGSSNKDRVAVTTMESFHVKGGEVGFILADLPNF